ncbi:MAG: hypothetical protein ACK6DA_03405 [Candidatus Kapaibacterium sp.]|jgi:hypothetical protein
MNRHKFSGFKSERREEMLVEALEHDMSSQDLFDKYQTELTTYGVTTYQELHSALYPKCTKLTTDLNLYIQNRENIQKMSSEKRAKVERVMVRYQKMGFNYATRTAIYENLRKSSGTAKESLEDLLADFTVE